MLVALALTATAATLDVDPAGPYPDLASAWAAAVDGDTVRLAPGDWVASDLERSHGRIELVPRDGPGTARLLPELDGIGVHGTAQLVVRDLVVDGRGASRLFDVLEQGRLEVSDTTLQGGDHPFHGGCVEVDDLGVVTLLRTEVLGCRSNVGGGVWVGDQATLRSALTRWEAGNAGVGGALRCAGGGCFLTGDAFVGNQGLFGAALSSVGGHPVLLDTVFEANGTLGLLPTADGGAVHAIGDLTVLGGRFCGNKASEGGALNVSGALVVAHSAFAANEADLHPAIALGTVPSRLEHALVLDHPGDTAAVEGAGVLEVSWSLFHGNAGGDLLDPVLGDGVQLGVDPGVAATCEALGAPLPAGSPARDAGDPALADPDGSPADLGARGGPWGPGDVDADGDGFTAATDCDDGDASVHPVAPEVPADGIDQDCDGADMCYADTDGDGFAGHALRLATTADCTGYAEGAEPLDCDDADATRFPGAFPRYDDADGDGVGGGLLEATCAPHDGVTEGGDCDDGDPLTYPGAPESCDAPDTDRDCDGLVALDDPDTSPPCDGGTGSTGSTGGTGSPGTPGTTGGTGTAPTPTTTATEPTTSTPTSTSPPDEAKGCGCASGSAPGLAVLLLLPLGLRRRQQGSFGAPGVPRSPSP